MVTDLEYILAWGGIPGGWEWIVILIINEAKDAKDDIESDVREIQQDIKKEVDDAAASSGDSDKQN
ncbi:MAG: hypothetical protein ACYSUL_13170 [Planctomycetota bacterium]|jgi:hypothetical protein